MHAIDASRGTPGHVSKDERAYRGREDREDLQDDGSTVTQSNPPNHGKVTNSPRARFLEEVNPDTLGENWIDELPQRFEAWLDPNQTLDDYRGEQ